MTILILAACVFLISSNKTLPSHPQDQATKQTRHSKKESEKSQIPATPPETVRDAQQPQDQTAQKNPNSQYPSWVDTLNAYSTATIAAFTIFTFCIFLYQIKVTHDSERAWLVINGYTHPERLEWRESLNRSPYPQEEFSWVIKNTGRTPARILDIQLRFHFVKDIKQLPSNPQYGNARCLKLRTIPTEGAIIPQNETISIAVYFESSNGEPSAPTQEQLEAVREKKASFLSYGSIRYKDVFKRNHETRFCYAYHFTIPTQSHAVIEGWFSPSGPEKYNITI